MSDEGQTEAVDTPEAVDTTEGGVAVAEEPTKKLDQAVEIRDIGPCKKHIKVTVERAAIDARFDEKYTEIVLRQGGQSLPGFRPGKAPRKLIERAYEKEVRQQVRGEVLMASLEQLAEEQDLAPLSPPDLDPAKIVIPPSGPFVYEFEVEVRPEFALPEYKGLKLKRPTQTFTDDDVALETKRILEPYGQIVPKEGDDVTVDLGDHVTCDIMTKLGDQILNSVQEIKLRVDVRLALRDGVAEKFGEQMKGAKVGDHRPVDIVLTDVVANSELRGKTVQATFTVKDIKTVRTPDLSDDLLEEFGVRSEEQLKELIRVVLDRRLEYQQRQAARSQVIALVAENALSELPQDLLRRQARRAMTRKVMEMRSAGMSEDEITGRQRLLQQDIIQSTTSALKEHFVLQKIAEVEKLEVDEADIDDEIDRIASRNDESPRKVRARLEREDLIEPLAAELLESKALDLILQSAEFEEVPLTKTADDAPVSTSEAQAVPGDVKEPDAEMPDEVQS